MLLRDERMSPLNMSGMTFAKIWVGMTVQGDRKHGLSSPVFSCELWSLSEQWGLYSQVG